MNLDTALAKMKECEGSDDTEVAHSNADKVLSTFLRTNGFRALADSYDRVPKWYA